MKKLIVAVLIMAGISATAQEHHRKGTREDMKDLTPEQVATLQTKKMTLALDLNESQQLKLKSILTEDAKVRKTKMDAREERKEEGKKVLSIDDKYALQNERLDHQIARKKEMKTLLTDEQFKKWEKMSHRMKKRGDQNKGKRSTK